MAKRVKRYTDGQVEAMAQAPWMWAEQIREAARARGCTLPSVAPVNDVVAWLRAGKKGG